MKYMILIYGSQQDIDRLTGATGDGSAWSAEDLGRMTAFMGRWNQALVDSGEFVDAHGLTPPVHARRVTFEEGAPVVTDGPYAETQEVLAGYNIVECESFDRATEIAAQLADTPHPAGEKRERPVYVDVRPIAEFAPEHEG